MRTQQPESRIFVAPGPCLYLKGLLGDELEFAQWFGQQRPWFGGGGRRDRSWFSLFSEMAVMVAQVTCVPCDHHS